MFYGDLATAPANPSRPGYTFQGWYTAPDGGEKWDFNKPVTGSMTLYAHWKANAYTVSFDANGGKASASSKMVVYDAAYGELPSASREGYSFAGWFTDRSGGERIAGDSVYSTPGDSTLYAHWAVNMVMVTYHMNDGSGASGGHEVAYGSVETEAPGPLREGYSFQGWYTAAQGGSKYDFSRPVTGDLDLYAHWKALPQLTRLAGDTRYDTMSRIVQAGGWKTGGTVVVASGSNYPDALAASGLSGVLNAPVVLTDGKVLSEQAADRIRELAPSKIVVAGGPAALSYGVETALASLCPKVGSRVWRHSRGHVPGAVPGRWVWVGRHGHRGNGSELCGRVVSELVCVPCEGSRVPMRSVHRPDRRAADRAERVQACAGRWRRGRRPVLVCGRPFGCGAAAGRHALRDERGDRQMGVLQRPPYGWRGVRDGRELPGRFGRRPARGRERWRGAAGGWSVLPGGVICDRI